MADSKVIAVLGVGPALGAAVARRFRREGFAVALMARSEDSLAPVADELRASEAAAAADDVIAVRVDAGDPASVATGFAKVRDALGPVDVFVYNAGAFAIGGILEIEPGEFERCWRANCMGGFLGAREVLPGMQERGAGTVIFTGATASLRGSSRFSCLAVGKFGLRALAQSMAREFGPRGVHVAHVVIDGQIDTPRIRQMSPDRADETLLSPDAIADTYWHLHAQHPTAWTLELDVRPSVEKF